MVFSQKASTGCPSDYILIDSTVNFGRSQPTHFVSNGPEKKQKGPTTLTSPVHPNKTHFNEKQEGRGIRRGA